MPTEHNDAAAHYDAIAKDYAEQYRRENLLDAEEYPANYFRLQILTTELARSGLKSVYEVGVGEGTPLSVMASMGFRVAGCDIAKNMVDAARSTFRSRGLNPDCIQWGDIEDSTTFAGQAADGQFDAAIAAGVLPHVKNDGVFLRNMGMIVRPGGKVFVEFRNKLFSLFTFNRHTKDFILNDLLAEVDDKVKLAVAKDIDARVALNLPPIQAKAKGSDAPGYDTILAKFHNPFELTNLFERSGYQNVKIHWYHYHPAPPMLEKALPKEFRKAAVALEHEGTWRGYFLCSAGVIEADRN